MSETPQFHPEIEKAMVTSGEDIGRLKDVDLAYDLALNEASELRKSEVIRDYEPYDTDKMTREFIAGQAVQKKAGNFLRGLTMAGLEHDKDPIDSGRVVRAAEVFVKEAETVGEEYNTLQRAAKRAKDSR